jgi:hypothetical protein
MRSAKAYWPEGGVRYRFFNLPLKNLKNYSLPSKDMIWVVKLKFRISYFSEDEGTLPM